MGERWIAHSLKDGHLEKLLPIWDFQQQVTPNYASYRYTTPFCDCHQHLNFWKTKPRPKTSTPPPCPNSLSAIAVSSWPATHTSSVPSIPEAPTPILALTFEKTLMLNPMNCGNPKGQAITTANSSCNQGSGGH